MMADPGDELLDERLRLVLLCAHPRLSREAAAALTLRLVLGISTDDIARLFLQTHADDGCPAHPGPQEAGGRAVRARPTGADLVERVGVVAQVAYLAFTAGYAPGSGPDVVRAELAGEAIRLVRVLRTLLPYDDSELTALQALMLLQHSRRDARVSDGAAGPAAGPGPFALARQRDRRGARPAPAAHGSASRAVPDPGVDRRRARDRRHARRHGVGPDRRLATTSCSRCGTPRSSGSAGRSRSRRRTGRRPA